MEWHDAQSGLPWEALLLFGGGFAIAGECQFPPQPPPAVNDQWPLRRLIVVRRMECIALRLNLCAFGICVYTAGFRDSGLSQVIGDGLSGLQNASQFEATLVICVVVAFLTEATSNSATTSIMMPILAGESH